MGPLNMKKRIKQSLSKLSRKRQTPQLDGRITNETVAEHREQILAGGRRFKYPVQYSRYRLVINSLLIILGALVLASVILWWQLYPAQNSSKFMYRITQIIPVRVADVDGERVPYSTYLKRFRSSIHYLQQQNNLNVNSKDGKKEVERSKRIELDNAIRDAYTVKLARENKVSVSNKEVDEFINKDLANKKVSLPAYEKTVLNAFYDWSMADYRGIVHSELLERKVGFAIDTEARAKADKVMASLRQPNADFSAIAKAESDDDITKASGGDSGDVSLKSLDTHGILAVAQKLQPGQISDLIYGTDGYYVLKFTSKTDSTIKYQVIKISLKELDQRLKSVKDAKKVKEYINVQPL